MRHRRHGAPRRVIEAALAVLPEHGIQVIRRSRVISSRPIGPSLRQYANAAALVSTPLDPPELLSRLKAMEAAFGRRRAGKRWSARVLDLDVVLWSGGIWVSPELAIPHREFRQRDFVLRPASEIVPDWRDPLTGLTMQHLFTRLTRPNTPLR